jgi:predicted phage tail protein
VDEFWLKVVSGAGALGLALYALFLFYTGKIVTASSAKEALERQAEEFRRELEYERAQKRELQEDNEKWVLRYTESYHAIHRAREVAEEAVNTAKEIASRSAQ